jgi:hypothetical protein
MIQFKLKPRCSAFDAKRVPQKKKRLKFFHLQIMMADLIMDMRASRYVDEGVPEIVVLEMGREGLSAEG